MARLSPGRTYGALNQLVGGFGEGYDSMSKWIREHREEEDKQLQRQKRDDVRKAIEVGPDRVTTTVGKQQQYGTDPMGNAATSSIGQPTQAVTTQDWASYRQNIMDIYMKAGDLAGANAASELISKQQQQGAMQYGGRALSQLQAGDLEGAAESLNQAYQYFPNGRAMIHQVMNGRLVAVAVDEETGEPVGEPVMVTPDYLQRALANLQDLKSFLSWTTDQHKVKLQGDAAKDLAEYRRQTIASQEADRKSRERIAAERNATILDAARVKQKGKTATDHRKIISGTEDFALKAFDKLNPEALEKLTAIGASAPAVAQMAGRIQAKALNDGYSLSDSEANARALAELLGQAAKDVQQAGGGDKSLIDSVVELGFGTASTVGGVLQRGAGRAVDRARQLAEDPRGFAEDVLGLVDSAAEHFMDAWYAATGAAQDVMGAARGTMEELGIVDPSAPPTGPEQTGDTAQPLITDPPFVARQPPGVRQEGPQPLPAPAPPSGYSNEVAARLRQMEKVLGGTR